MGFNNRNISALGRVIYPSLLWNLPANTKTLYLTFDDGPIPEITPWVLSLLKEFNAKATFFCIGDNIAKHPKVFKQILAEGHSIGNHSFNHLNGWKTSAEDYVENVFLTEYQILKSSSETESEKIEGRIYNSRQEGECKANPYTAQVSSRSSHNDGTSSNLNLPAYNTPPLFSKLFRPPFGKISPVQIKKLQQRGYKIVMWDVLSEDYNRGLSAEKCFKNVINYAKPGSIIVFHDSLKASANLQEILPKVLKFYKEKGYEFKGL